MGWLKNRLKNLAIVSGFLDSLDNLNQRREFVESSLREVEAGSILLDAGCGSQQFRDFAGHLTYRSQDFGQYTGVSPDGYSDGFSDFQPVTGQVNDTSDLDYVGDIWEIEERDDSFDAILCTEVFEHIPYPAETVREFSRLLKSGGKLVLTVPSNCLRHMDPYFFYSGFSDRWLEHFLSSNGFKITFIEAVGDYNRWMAVETWRSLRSASLLGALSLAPSFWYYYSRKKNRGTTSMLCMGYHIIATKVV